MRLSELVAVLGEQLLEIDPPGADREIVGLDYDSRRIEPGYLFFAITGYQQDGRKYIPQALEKGAVAVVSQHPEALKEAVRVRVKNIRRAMALMSSAFYGHPAQRLTAAAITGTAGKTTTSYLLRSILRAAGQRVGLIGTIRYLIEDRSSPAPNTTPESLDLQRLLAEMVQAGLGAVVMEASSHGIELERVAGIPLAAAVFTNFSQDHLDFHGDMENYFRAKRKLFEELPPESWAVVNGDDERSQQILAATRARHLTFGLKRRDEVQGRILFSDISGSQIVIRYQGQEQPVKLNLPGRHNVYNGLAAAAAAISLGVDLRTVARGLEQVASVDGRMERIDMGQDFTVLVDYAHTPEELERLLAAVRSLSPKRIIAVFGCGGDRDRSKRSLMGRAVARQAEMVIVTSDNPRTEDPEAIIEDILPGLEGAEYLVIVDRRQAIREAMALAQPGDAVVIAGKGHEDYQIIGTTKIHFDDREEAREAIKSRQGG